MWLLSEALGWNPTGSAWRSIIQRCQGLFSLVVVKGDARFIVDPSSALRHGSPVRMTFIFYLSRSNNAVPPSLCRLAKKGFSKNKKINAAPTKRPRSLFLLFSSILSGINTSDGPTAIFIFLYFFFTEQSNNNSLLLSVFGCVLRVRPGCAAVRQHDLRQGCEGTALKASVTVNTFLLFHRHQIIILIIIWLLLSSFLLLSLTCQWALAWFLARIVFLIK